MLSTNNINFDSDPVVVKAALQQEINVTSRLANESNNNNKIQIFTLSCSNGTTIELSSLGASITKFLIPKNGNKKSHSDGADYYDDIVLGYESCIDQYEANNPYYFSCIVGRVANRIANGQFTLNNNTTYKLECNSDNNRNHLHGGTNGVWNQIWDGTIIENNNDNKSPKIHFKYISQHINTDGYPGTVEINAIYSLRTCPIKSNVITLSLQMNAKLLLDDQKEEGNKNNRTTIETPMNLAQHSYFNLAGHDNYQGILNHSLRLNCSKYTPIHSLTSIPTRQVVSVLDNDDDDTNNTNKKNNVMNWITKSRSLQTALNEYGVIVAGLNEKESTNNIHKRLQSIKSVAIDSNAKNPYGFDHNYIIDQNNNHNHTTTSITPSRLNLVGVVKYKNRRLTVSTDVPGVQLYTSNYLNGNNPIEGIKKSSQLQLQSQQSSTTSSVTTSCYGQWQGLCLETQHYPDSINVNQEIYPEYAKGKCIILSNENPTYEHNVEYCIEYDYDHVNNSKSGGVDEEDDDDNDYSRFSGNDTLGQEYESPDEMWQLQIFSENNNDGNNGTESWYNRAATYYEDNCTETVKGVLGGYDSISDIDILGSMEFIHDVQQIRPSFLRWTANKTINPIIACECGAGIGRVTKHLLLSSQFPVCIQACHLIESSSRLISAAPEYIGDPAATKCSYYCTGLQHWNPRPNTYSIIWILWVFIYLTDDDMIKFLRRCGNALVDDGLIIIKENTCINEDFQLEVDDASVTRSSRYWKYLLKQAGLRIVYEKIQTNFPDELFPDQ